MRVAVASGKGGTGKTTVAVNLAVAAARAGRTVHLGDCDVEEPNAHLFLGFRQTEARAVTVPVPVVDQDACLHCGECGGICEFNAVACLPERTLIIHELCHACGGCARVCEPGAIDEEQRVVGEVATGFAAGLAFTTGRMDVGEVRPSPVIAAVKEHARDGELVILDAPPGTACPAVETLLDVDLALLVAEPTPFGMHDLELALKLVRKLGLPCGVVVNRDTGEGNPVGKLCGREGVPVLARLPYRRSVAVACAEGGLALEADPQIAEALTSLAERLVVRGVRT